MRKIMLMILLISTLIASSCIPMTISDEEKGLLMTESYFESYFNDDYVEPVGKYSKNLYSHRAKEIKYAYIDENSDGMIVVLFHTISFDSLLSEAEGSYVASVGGFKFGNTLSGKPMEFIEFNETPYFGDQSYFAILKKDGYIVGNAFVVRRNNTVHSIMFGGSPFLDADTFYDFVMPYLLKSDEYNQNILTDIRKD